MVGGIIIAVILLVVFPVLVSLGMGALAAMLAMSTNRTANAEHAGSELWQVAHADPYHHD